MFWSAISLFSNYCLRKTIRGREIEKYIQRYHRISGKKGKNYLIHIAWSFFLPKKKKKYLSELDITIE